MMSQAKAEDCGHFVETFPFMALCRDGVIRTSILAPLICEACRIMREAHGMDVPKGSRVIEYKASDWSAQKPEWAAELRRLDAIAAQEIRDTVRIAWPESIADVYLIR